MAVCPPGLLLLLLSLAVQIYAQATVTVTIPSNAPPNGSTFTQTITAGSTGASQNAGGGTVTATVTAPTNNADLGSVVSSVSAFHFDNSQRGYKQYTSTLVVTLPADGQNASPVTTTITLPSPASGSGGMGPSTVVVGGQTSCAEQMCGFVGWVLFLQDFPRKY